MDPGRPVRLDGHLLGRVPRAVRDQQLLDVAERLFTTHGHEGTSIEDVARAAGVSRPVVYQHYGDKDELFVACVRRARAELHEALAAATTAAGLSTATALRRAGGTFFDRLQRDPRRTALLLTAGTGQLADRLAELRDATAERVAALFGEHLPGLDAVDRQAAAHAVVGVAEELARWWLRSPEVPVELVTGYFTRFVTHGMVGAIAAGDPTGDVPERR